VAKIARAADKRVERSKAAVLAETFRQLSRSGLAGVSIDEVSRVSGVSKTTIYRHWPSRAALLIEACTRLGGAPVLPDTGSLRGDIQALAAQLAAQLRDASWSAVYPSIIDAAERDAELAAMQAAWHKAHTLPFEAAVARAKRRGEMAPERRAEDLIAAIMGPLFYRRWFSKEPLDERFVNAVVEAAVAAAMR
jgi:AcrR family transcriptional regulator